MQPQHLTQQAAFARPRHKAADPGAVRAAGVSQRVREEKGTFSLPEITADLFPVSRETSLEVQHVVGDLECQPEQVAEAIEAVEIAIVAIGNKRADSQRKPAAQSSSCRQSPEKTQRPSRQVAPRPQSSSPRQSPLKTQT